MKANMYMRGNSLLTQIHVSSLSPRLPQTLGLTLLGVSANCKHISLPLLYLNVYASVFNSTLATNYIDMKG